MTSTTASPAAATAPASKKHDLQYFVAIKRFFKLPLIWSGVEKVLHVYTKVKTSNRAFDYSFGKMENIVFDVVDMSVLLVHTFVDPFNIIDDLMCTSLDVVEKCIPIVNYTPEEIYFNTKTYVKDKVKLILKCSMMPFTLLDYTLSLADVYVDKYLPDKDPSEDDKPSTEPSNQIVKPILHAYHFFWKLPRRLTRRTIAEAKLLIKQLNDTVQCFVYLEILLVVDRKAFAEQIIAVWTHLSKDKPKNQKPAENIKQLIEMLSREGARRYVHLTNFVIKTVFIVSNLAGRAVTYNIIQSNWVIMPIVITFDFLKTTRIFRIRKLLFSFIELAKNPTALAEKLTAIWTYFSEDVDLIHDRPETFKELFEMYLREGARCFVHMTNMVVKSVYMVAVYEFAVVSNTHLMLRNYKLIVEFKYIRPLWHSYHDLVVMITDEFIKDYISCSCQKMIGMKPEKVADKPFNKNNALTANNKSPKDEKHNSTSANNKPSPKDENNINVAHTTLTNGKRNSLKTTVIEPL